jgi:hypothetical protein
MKRHCRDVAIDPAYARLLAERDSESCRQLLWHSVGMLTLTIAFAIILHALS